MLMVVGTLLPVVLFAGAIVHRLSQQEKVASERRITLAARNLAGAVESEIKIATTTLLALAESQRLDHSELEAFYSEAQRVARTQPSWLTVILLSPDGRQLLNTRYPLRTALPPVNEPESLQSLKENPRPTVGNLAPGRTGRLAFPVRVPVVRNGKLRYVLTAVITPEALSHVIKSQSPTEGEWTRALVDNNGIFIARTRDSARFVGKRAKPSFLERIKGGREGFYRETSLDGVPVYVGFCHIGDSRWTASVAVPITVIDAPSRRAMALIAGIGVLLILASGTGALFLAQRIATAIASATTAAESLSKGEVPRVPHTSIQEVALLGKALESSAELLAQRAHERDENLARAEAARAQAEAASHLKDEFLITVSHELRTPLNAILGWANLLRSGQLDSEMGPRALDIIERNSRSLSRLVDDLLDMSRIITGKLGLDIKMVDLANVINGTVDSVRPAAEAKEITLNLNITPAIFVSGDASRLQQVVWNLLSNAVKFTPKGGHVAVSLAQSHSHAEITVTDSGVGIEPEFLTHVFDRFRQADGSTTRKFGGLGLGLAIVRQLVELHGGTVHVDSAGEGKGATFAVHLPLAAVRLEDNGTPHPTPLLEAGEPASADRADSPRGMTGARILVVDDDYDARMLISTILKQQGAEVLACSSASQAFEEVKTWKPAVIISDIGMPQHDGYNFIRMVRDWEVQSGGEIPAAALTALARPEDRARALASGYQIHIAKPVEPTALTDAITELLGDKG